MVINVDDSNVEWKILKLVEDKRVDDLLALRDTLNDFVEKRKKIEDSVNGSEKFYVLDYIFDSFTNVSIFCNKLDDGGLLKSLNDVCYMLKSKR